MKKYIFGTVTVVIIVGTYLFFSWDYLKYRSVAKDFSEQEVGYSENVNTYDHLIDLGDLENLFQMTLERTHEKGTLYKVNYIASASGKMVLWQFEDRHLCMRYYQGNDSNGISWEVEKGEYVFRDDWRYKKL